MSRTVKEITQELEIMNRDTNSIRDILRIAEDQIKILETELKAVCEHPEHALKNESKYHPGTYSDKASTTHWTVCTVCDAKSETWETVHSNYG